jgi:hypothetical protein
VASQAATPPNEQVMRGMFDACPRGDDRTLQPALADEVI